MTIILFIVSMFGIGIMIASKVFEIKVRKIHFLAKIFTKGDEKIHKTISVVTFKYYRYKKIIEIFVFEFLPSYLYELLVKMKDFVSKKYYSAGDNFRGRKILRNNGSVSFFLERLSDDKSNTDVHKV
ncbi:MAG: hypothetical protein WAX85_03345 [Minisyncoccia bacterium]